MGSEQPSYYSIITADVRYDEGLSANEKLLYGEITALLNFSGVCWATNNYFAKLYDVTKETVSKWISHLQDRGYICVQVLKDAQTKQVLQRTITLPTQISIGIDENINTPIDKNINTPIDKNVKENNINKNNTRLEYIKENIKKKKFIPPTKEEVMEYGILKQRVDLVDFFFDYYNTGEWKNKDGKPVSNWKQTFITWINHSPQKQKTENKTHNFQERKYTKEQFDSFMDDIENIKI